MSIECRSPRRTPVPSVSAASRSALSWQRGPLQVSRTICHASIEPASPRSTTLPRHAGRPLTIATTSSVRRSFSSLRRRQSLITRPGSHHRRLGADRGLRRVHRLDHSDIDNRIPTDCNARLLYTHRIAIRYELTTLVERLTAS